MAVMSSPSVVFLGHGTQLSCVFYYWFSYSDTYWRASWWMENWLVYLVVLFITAIWLPISVICLGFNPVLFADTSLWPRKKVCSSIPEDSLVTALSTSNNSLNYNADTMLSEVWIVKCFGWQYFSSWSIWQNYAKGMVVRSVLQAEKQGVNVIVLGALNKAYWLNDGGQEVLNDFIRIKKARNENDVECGIQQVSGIKIIHGNTLTSAVVCHQLEVLLKEQNSKQDRIQLEDNYNCNDPDNLDTTISEKKCQENEVILPVLMDIIVLGATSKIGRAVAVTMAGFGGVRVICVGIKSGRMTQVIEEGKEAAKLLYSARTDIENLCNDKIKHCADVTKVSEMAPIAIWLIGKGGGRIVQSIPPGSTVLSFAVPCPLAATNALRGKGEALVSGRYIIRDDIRYIDCGVLVLPYGMIEQRQFCGMLPKRLLYSCHAAAIVHDLEGWNHHEVGEVVLRDMATTLKAAFKHGFTLDALHRLPRRRLSMLPRRLDSGEKTGAPLVDVFLSSVEERAQQHRLSFILNE
jgi:hypothetical protein